jgi:glycine oxidase
MLAPYTEAAEGGPLLTLGARSLALFGPFVERVQAESGVNVNYRETGSLHVARSSSALAHFELTRNTLAALDVPATLLTPAEVRAHEPHVTSNVQGGLLLPSQALVSAPAITRAMVSAARRHGAVLLDPARAVRLTPGESGVAIETDRGPLQARVVVLAAGAWSASIAIDGVTDAVPVTPIRGQLLHLGWDGTPVSRITWDDHCYVVPWQDGTLLVGATVEDVGFDERTTTTGVQRLLAAVCDLLPHAAIAQLSSARAGLRPATPDGLPLIGWSSVATGVMYATGHYRNGVLLAPLTADMVAGAILDGRNDTAFGITAPGRFGNL